MTKYWKHILIVVVFGYCAWLLYPTVKYYTMPSEVRDNLTKVEKDRYLDSVIKLGLDLQGGMHLVLEIDDSGLNDDEKKDALDRAIKIIRNRVDQFGVSEPVIQKQGEKRIIVQLPGLADPERARKLIGETAQLDFRLVREPDELGRVLRDLDTALKGVTVTGTRIDSTAADEEDASIGLDGADVAASDASREDTLSTAFDTLLQSIPGIDDVEVPLRSGSEDAPFTGYLVTAFGGAVAVEEENREAINLLLQTPQARRVIPRNSMFMWENVSKPIQGGGQGRLLYLVEKRPTLSGEHLINATTRPDPDDPSTLNISFTLDRTGGMIFSRFTGDNIGRRIAISLDNLITSAPVVQSKIPGGEGRITGQFSDEEANDLAILLRAGALPAPLSIKEERTVGPTLGHDSIVLGVRAAMLGFGLVLLFMLIYYKGSGLLACVALVLNLIIVMAVLTQLRAALTLPGIAGLILTIGLAVDANVLIFERIREELAKAKTVRSAIDSGFDRAFTTILDANLTTLITAFVLWQFGTGPIKGFATTLSIGIIASMFTALMCTRIVFQMITGRWSLKKLSI